MPTSDSIADALIRIKNGYRVGSQSVNLRYSKLILEIVKILKEEGYISSLKQQRREIIVSLKYNGRIPALTDVKRVSKPSLRIYKGVKDLPKVLSGRGCAIISTPKGVMTDKTARKLKTGGEVLALLW